MTRNITQTPTRRSLLKKLLLAAAFLILLFLVALTALILPSQVRPVPPPPQTELTGLPGANVSTSQSDATSLTTETCLAAAREIVRNALPSFYEKLENDPNETNTGRQAARKAAIEFMKKRDDSSNWSPEERAMIEKVRADVTNLIAEYLTLPGKTRSLSYQEALEQFSLVQKKGRDLRRHSSQLPGNMGILYYTLGECGTKVTIEILADHQEWISAGKNAWNHKDYDRAIYYFRQGGVAGRLSQAGCTIQTFIVNKIIVPNNRLKK